MLVLVYIAIAIAKSLQSCLTLCDPWDSPGKNTGVGCHFLLQCMKVKSESEVAQSCPTLSDPMDCSLQGSIHGIFQARVLEWGAIALDMIKLSFFGTLSFSIYIDLCNHHHNQDTEQFYYTKKKPTSVPL